MKRWECAFVKSIFAKIIALFLFTVILSSLWIGIVCTIETYSILHKSAEDQLITKAQMSAEKLNSIFEKVEESVDTLHHYAKQELTDISQLQSEESLAQFLSAIESVGVNHARSTNGVLSVYARFEPTVVGYDTAGYAFVKDDETGEMLATEVTPLNHYQETDIEHVGWWYIPKKAGKASWIDSYYSNKFDTWMISYTVPVYFEETFIGVVGMDVECDYIASIANNIEVYETGNVSVLNQNFSILVHSDFKIGDTVNDDKMQYGKISDMFENGEPKKELIEYTLGGKDKLLSLAMLDNGMTVCVSANKNEIYAQQNDMIFVIVITIILFAIVALILAYVFARKITKPIMDLNVAAKQMIGGNLDVKLTATTKDEIGQLTDSFNKARETLKEQISLLYDEAHHDGLTGANNKTAFTEAEKSIEKRLESGNYSFLVAVLDVNRLKVTNDILGHNTGDALLRTIATHLKSYFPLRNIYRIGGDEFAILLEGEDAEGGEEKVNACINEMENLRLADYPDMRISCAYGVALFDPHKDKTFSDTLQRADKRMYYNKSVSKKNQDIDPEETKGLRRLQIDKYLEFLKTFSASTEDYLYLVDLENKATWLFGNISPKYDLCNNGPQLSCVEEVLKIIHPSDTKAVVDDLAKIFNGDSGEHNLDYRLVTREGNNVWVNCRGRVIYDNSGAPLVLIGSLSEDALRSLYNPLTGLFNKTKFLKDLENGALPAFNRFMLLNIDNLTYTNLAQGRSFGDEMIKRLSSVLEARFPLNKLYHMEKDRFALLLDVQDNSEIETIFADIQKALEGEFTASAAVIPTDSLIENENLYAHAKQLLHENKSLGQGHLAFYSRVEMEKHLSSAELLEEVEDSIANGYEGFYLCFQPQATSKTYSVSSAETLLRYSSKNRGPVFPDELIPLLERTKLINKVGLWVCDTALAYCKKWRESIPDFRISVNISAVQLQDEHIADKIISLLKKHGLPGNALTIELTESVQLENLGSYVDIFKKLQRVDIRVSIDDFGTGYANLSYLKKIHADEIKIDREFTKDIREATYNYTLIKNIIEFAKTNNLKICLEGIETVSELAILDALEPDILQGYLFDKPIRAEEFEEKYLRFPQGNGWPFLVELRDLTESMQILSLDTREILSQLDIGLWVLSINRETGENRMIIDSKMRMLTGLSSEAAPQTCYETLIKGIHPAYIDTMREMIANMSETPKVHQVEFCWIHPTKGEIQARLTGKCVKKLENSTIFEGFLKIISDLG